MPHAPSLLFPSHMSTTSLSTCTPVRPCVTTRSLSSVRCFGTSSLLVCITRMWSATTENGAVLASANETVDDHSMSWAVHPVCPEHRVLAHCKQQPFFVKVTVRTLSVGATSDMVKSCIGLFPPAILVHSCVVKCFSASELGLRGPFWMKSVVSCTLCEYRDDAHCTPQPRLRVCDFRSV